MLTKLTVFLALALSFSGPADAETTYYHEDAVALGVLAKTVLPAGESQVTYTGRTPAGEACKVSWRRPAGANQLKVEFGNDRKVAIELAAGRSFYGSRTGSDLVFVYFINDDPHGIPGQFGDGFRIRMERRTVDGHAATEFSLRRTRADDLAWSVLYEEQCTVLN